MDLMQVLGDAKSLTKLTLWGSSLLSKRGLAHVLRKCPSLVELRVGGSWFGAKEEGTSAHPKISGELHLWVTSLRAR